MAGKKYIKTVEVAELTGRPYSEILSLVNTGVLPGYKTHRGLVSGGQVTDTSCDDVRATFEDEHPKNKVDASDAYALSLFPFGREDKTT